MLSTVDLLVLASFGIVNIFLFFYETSYPNEEVNGTDPEPFPSGSVPWSIDYFHRHLMKQVDKCSSSRIQGSKDVS